jgi:phosphoribosylformylglycinamidine cyclo-ligase
VHALAHVTGGGIAGNLIRVLPEGRRAEVSAPAPRPPLFRWLCEVGAIPEPDAREALNLGAGMLVIAAREHADALAADLARRGESVLRLGAIRDGAREVVWMD